MTRYHEPHRSWTDDAPTMTAEDLRAMQDRFDEEYATAGDAHRADAFHRSLGWAGALVVAVGLWMLIWLVVEWAFFS